MVFEKKERSESLHCNNLWLCSKRCSGEVINNFLSLLPGAPNKVAVCGTLPEMLLGRESTNILQL